MPTDMNVMCKDYFLDHNHSCYVDLKSVGQVSPKPANYWQESKSPALHLIERMLGHRFYPCIHLGLSYHRLRVKRVT